MTELIFHKITRLIVILKIIIIRYWIVHCKILRRKKTDVNFLVLLKTLVLMVSFLHTYLHFLTGFFTLFFSQPIPMWSVKQKKKVSWIFSNISHYQRVLSRQKLSVCINLFHLTHRQSIEKTRKYP